jgi:biopolymer transport protein ExbB
VFAAVAKKWGRPSVELEQSIIDSGDRAAASLRRYLRLFSLVSTISPLLGLIGTVFGMIRLFNGISMTEAMGKAELLAAGISEALFTTAAGLMLAVPAMCIYVYFLGRVDRLSIDIDGLSQEFADMISAEALHDDRRQRERSKARPPTAA